MPESYKEDGRPAQQWYWDDWFSAFDVRLCSVGARGVWIDMLGIMFKAEIRGTLTINGKQVDNKTLAKIVGDTIANVDKYLKELEEHDVFSRLDDNTIICRRMFRESGRKDHISQIRSEAGKRGAEARWQIEQQKMANMATSSSTPTPTAIPTSNNKKALKKEMHKEEATEVLKYFNERTGKNFRKDPQNFISGRLNDGFTVEDCKRVVDIKTAQWLNDPENNKWLRPETLFRPTKFESYLNERMPTRKLEPGQSTYNPSKKDQEYEKARAAKLNELWKKHNPEIEKAKKDKDVAKLEDIENRIKEELAEFSREYHG